MYFYHALILFNQYLRTFNLNQLFTSYMNSILLKKGFFFSLALSVTLLFSNNVSAQMRQVYLDNIAGNEIYKLSFYSPSEGYVAFRDWIGYTTDSGRTFTKRYITNSNVNYNGYSVNLTFGFGISGVKAFNQNTIIAYGDYGLVPAILYSTNGGTSYTLIYHSQFDPNNLSTGIMDMIFPQNGSIGYAIDADRILKTTNQGLNWSPVLTSPNSCYDRLDATDNNNIFAISDYSISNILFPNGRTFINNKIDNTNNGGTNWQRLNTPAGQIKSASFVTALKGWLNLNQDLFYTSNGGGWTQKNNSTITPFFASKIKFINDSTGFALNGLFEIIKTTDSGRAWEPLVRDNNYTYGNYSHNDLQLLSSTQLWAGGAHGFLEISTNGGGIPIPKAHFQVDTVGVSATGNVNLINLSKRGYQYKWFVNSVLISANYNTSYTHNVYVPKDTIQLIVNNGTNTDTSVQIQEFNFTAPPLITSFTPTSAAAGTSVIISGFGFTGATSVTFGGIPAASFVVNSFWSITAVLGGGLSGNVSVTTPIGTGIKSGFIYLLPGAPLITSFFPENGLIGTTVTISGNNFRPIAAENIVYFGKVKATVVSATSTQIICTVPPGGAFAPISVINSVGNSLGSSVKHFSVTYPGAGNLNANSFSQALHIPIDPVTTTDIFPIWVLSADIDGDGKNDIIGNVRYYLVADSIFIYRNNTNSANLAFEPRKTVGTGYSTVYADLDGDGKLDLAFIDNYNSLKILRNTSNVGNISFAPFISIPLTNASHRLEARDLDGDGRVDIILSGFNNNTLGVFMNISVGSSIVFAPIIEFPSIGGPFTLAIGDLSGDGKPDVIVSGKDIANPNICKIAVYKNTSSPQNISFDPKFDLTVIGAFGNASTSSAFIADVDGDGKLDIVLNNGGATPTFSVYRNTSSANSITFGPRIDYTSMPSQTSIIGELSNFRGDSIPDFITGIYGDAAFTLNKNISTPGTVNFENSNTYGTHGDLWSETASDLDGDGKQDVIVASASWSPSFGFRGFYVFKNQIGEPVTFTLCEAGNTSISADVTGSTYQWQVDTGTGFTNLSNNSNISGAQTITLGFTNIPISWNGYKFRCLVNNVSYTSIYIMKVKPVVLPTISISTPATTSCYNTNVTFTATATTGNAVSFSYKWLVNNNPISNNTPTYTTNSLNNNDNVKCIIITIDSCSNNHYDTSNAIIMTVYGGPNTIIINTPNANICAGTSATFTATVTNAGASPSYQWYINSSMAGTNSNTFTTSTLNNNDVVKCILTIIGTCMAPSNSIIMYVNTGPVIPGIIISTPNTTICAGTAATFTAATTNGGFSPTYQWQINGVNVGTNSNTYTSSTLNNNDQVSCILTSNAACAFPGTANSNIITMNVSTSGVVPVVTIATGTTTICSGTSVIFTATPTYGGNNPTYQWKVNGVNAGNNSNVFSTATLTNGSTVQVAMTSNASCVSSTTALSNIITITVNTVIPSASITASSTNICPGANILFTATTTNGGTTPVYQWKKNGANVGTNTATFSSSNLSNGDVISVVLTSNAACANPAFVNSNNINISVNAVTPATISISGVTTVSQGASSVISSTITNAGSSPVYQWKDSTDTHNWQNIIGATTASINYSPALTGNKIRCILTGNSPCVTNNTVTSNALTFTVTPSFAGPTFYPNPVSNYLIVDGLQRRKSWESVHVITMAGAKVVTVPDLTGLTRVTVDVSTLPPGIYMCVLNSRFGYAEYYKFVKL